MKKRPIAVTIVSILFVVVGLGGMIRGVWTLLAGRGGITRHALIDVSLVEITSLAALLSACSCGEGPIGRVGCAWHGWHFTS